MRGRRLLRTLAAGLVILALAPSAGLAGADAGAIAREAALRLQEATAALEQADRARDRVTALAGAIDAYEDGLRALREGVRRASLRERAIARDVEARRDRIAQLLGVLTTLERAPRPLLMIHPSGPLGTARSGMILSEVTPALQVEAAALRAQLEEVALLRAIMESAEADLSEGLRGVQRARVALSEAMARRTDLPARLTDDPEAVSRLLEDAETLDSFATGLLRLQGAAEEAVADFADLRGRLPLPLEGTVLRGFGDADAAGIRRPGWVLAVGPAALVRAPVEATLRYAGPLLDYGNVIILEPAADHLIVMAGLGEVFGTEGQPVRPGDPLGLMGGSPPEPGEFLVEATRGGGSLRRETLYIEIRQSGQPVDPAQWFRPDGG